MAHLLDNPIWHALTTGNQHLALGSASARCFPPEVGPLAGLQDNRATDLTCLLDLVPAGQPVVLFTPGPLPLTDAWQPLAQKDLLQLVYSRPAPAPQPGPVLRPLTQQHVPAMLALTALTNPGPFRSRTIELGTYYGIFDGARLVAMAGHRLRPEPYAEVSAVCTHPEYLGRGYAGLLVGQLLREMQAAGHRPFLHVLATNTGALALYQRLGFQLRRQLQVYYLQRATR
ncbi:GNAT family N-acetyltransferase [Hymenobacter aquaticus]|uniref:GNAT family N-acetyltransferase n=1 Tax=Hymenobacter aquaticus TaxID=1867101 RepID=A0A4Z0Q294_9BACT|nr:GNAT family N-acetyltransferase [Hymenobacter aquaticus]TGE24208.1 GNAT family N-acetyltransferase [Hymenobacter aquaticus]